MYQRAAQFGPSTSSPNHGSRTMTITTAPPVRGDDDDSGDVEDRPDGPVGVLRLRGGPRNTRQRVVWDDDVVDNEGCGRKKSKICCIYHKPKPFDESSSEDDSSDSDSDSSCGHAHNHRRRNSSSSPSHGPEGATQATNDGGSMTIHELEEEEIKNAYEIAPTKKGKRKAAV